LLECGNAAARRPYRSAVSRLRKQMEMSHRLLAATVEDWQAAWLAYERGEADNAGIVDQVSFAVMRRLGILRKQLRLSSSCSFLDLSLPPLGR